MKKIQLLTIIVISILTLGAKAQDAGGLVIFRRIYNLDTTATEQNKVGSLSFLYFKGSRSLYVYNRRKDMKGKYKNDEDKIHAGSSSIRLEEDWDEFGEMFYTEFDNQQLVDRELIWGKPFITHEPLPPINWIIDTGFRTIGGFHCQKAYADFRGRHYESWFTREIPASTGPWKLHGLPGIILEAYDIEKQVQWLFESIQIPYDTGRDLMKPAQGKVVPFEQYKDLLRKESEKMAQFVQATAERGSDIIVDFQYFPIEKSYD